LERIRGKPVRSAEKFLLFPLILANLFKSFYLRRWAQISGHFLSWGKSFAPYRTLRSG
jgi:hypothetical protein